MSRDPQDLSQAFATPTSELVGIYDDWSSSYDDDVRSWGYAVPERLAATLARRCQPGGVTVLDAGCGTGLSGEALRGAGFESLVGIDVSPASLELASARGIYADLAVVDLTAPLPLTDDAVDAAMSAGVFTYLPDPEASLRELARVTRGPVVISQRTDLWETRSMDEVVGRLRADGMTIDVGEPLPYLPGHPEYADDIRVIEVVVSAS